MNLFAVLKETIQNCNLNVEILLAVHFLAVVGAIAITSTTLLMFINIANLNLLMKEEKK